MWVFLLINSQRCVPNIILYVFLCTNSLNTEVGNTVPDSCNVKKISCFICPVFDRYSFYCAIVSSPNNSNVEIETLALIRRNKSRHAFFFFRLRFSIRHGIALSDWLRRDRKHIKVWNRGEFRIILILTLVKVDRSLTSLLKLKVSHVFLVITFKYQNM